MERKMRARIGQIWEWISKVGDKICENNDVVGNCAELRVVSSKTWSFPIWLQINNMGLCLGFHSWHSTCVSVIWSRLGSWQIAWTPFYLFFFPLLDLDIYTFSPTYIFSDIILHAPPKFILNFKDTIFYIISSMGYISI